MQFDSAFTVHQECVCQCHVHATARGIAAGGKAGCNPALAKLLGPHTKKQKLDSPAAASLPLNGELQTPCYFWCFAAHSSCCLLLVRYTLLSADQSHHAQLHI